MSSSHMGRSRRADPVAGSVKTAIRDCIAGLSSRLRRRRLHADETERREREKLVIKGRKELGMGMDARGEQHYFNVAVVGQSGAGKSSLINALRKLGDADPGAAPVGEPQTTAQINKYEHPALPHLALWEIPGAGTLWQPSTSYFETQQLYAFDCILVVTAERFMEVAFEIAAKATQWGKPCVFVRTKADLAARSIAKRKKTSMREASNDLRRVVKESFQENLKLCGLSSIGSSWEVFIVSSWAFTDADAYVNGDDTSLDAMDEAQCLKVVSQHAGCPSMYDDKRFGSCQASPF